MFVDAGPQVTFLGFPLTSHRVNAVVVGSGVGGKVYKLSSQSVN